MRRKASADAIFQAFDRQIDTWVGKNRPQLVDRYRKAAGRPVEDSELNSFLNGLGDRLYEDIQLDPGATKRFVEFHASDQKLWQMADDLVEDAAVSGRLPAPPMSQAASQVSQPSELARRVAAAWLARR